MATTIINNFLSDGDTVSFIKRVENADGEPLEDGVKVAYKNFIQGCKIDRNFDKIKACCIMAGARTLAGALTPLVGVTPVNIGFVQADYSRKNGLKGDGLSKLINTGRANNADPQNDKHIAVYHKRGIATSNTYLFGSNDFGTSGTTSLVIDPINNRYIVRLNAGGGGGVIFGFQDGFLGINRLSSSVLEFTRDSSANSLPYNSQSPSSNNIYLFGYSGLPSSDSQISFYSIGEGVNMALLRLRVQTLMNSLNLIL